MIGISASILKEKLPGTVSEERFHVSRDYVRALTEEGAVSCILPIVKSDQVAEVVASLSGLILSGGDDLAPHFSIKKKHLSLAAHYAGENDALRDLYEIALCREALKHGIPVLGICRGAQLLNVALGGTLNQEITGNTAIAHVQEAHQSTATHDIRIFSGSLLHEITGSNQLGVNSFHHQSIDLLGKHLEISAISEDGVIEAIEYQGASFALGVQWHPEAMTESSVAMKNIFARFVQETRWSKASFKTAVSR